MNQNDMPISALRREFFAFRNGIVAEKLRSAGDPHTAIMGCLLVDLTNIARQARDTIADNEQLAALAQELWDNTHSRECRLTAPMLYPVDRMNLGKALEWCESVETVEVADNLCHKLLRHLPEADTLFRHLIAQERTLTKYTGYRLLLNLLRTGKAQPSPALKAIIINEANGAEHPLSSLLAEIGNELDE